MRVKLCFLMLLTFILGQAIIAQKIEIMDWMSSSYLGIQMTEITKDNYSKYGLNSVQGVAVEKVVENSPAAQAGLKPGDVIIKFNNEEVTSVRKLKRLISEVAPDHQVRIKILRNGKEQELIATMGKRSLTSFQGIKLQIPDVEELRKRLPKSEDDTWFDYLLNNKRYIGVNVMSLNDQLANYFGVSDGKGVLVTYVAPNSPAARAGLQAGDVIMEIDGKEITSIFDLSKAINSNKEANIRITIMRNKSKQTLVVTPENSEQIPQKLVEDASES